MTKHDGPLTTLEGTLDRITFFNAETLYIVARLKPLKTGNTIAIVGHMAAVQVGETLQIQGTWESHPRYGQQFKIESYTTLLPAGIAGIEKYLQSGFIKGIGPSTAKQLVARFGIETFDVIENFPQRLTEIEGIGKKKAALIRQHWKQHHVVRGLLQFLQSVGVKPSFCAKIIGEYGLEAEAVIRQDPYRLSTDIPGIGFYVADSVARHLGISKSEPERARAAILHFIGQAVHEGHMFVHRDPLIQQCETLFEIGASRLGAEIDRLDADHDLVVETIPGDSQAAVYLNVMHQAESGLANRLKAMLSVPIVSSGMDPDGILQAVLQKLALKLSDDQLGALEATLSHHVVIITGGPGTGKTTLIRSVNAIFEAQGRRVLLAAPTGRAAKRLSEVTYREAKTIHRLLGYNLQEGWFEKNPDNPLETDMVIVDEASMVDTALMHHLLRAIPMTAGLVLVGDIFQLPPVGPGNVLAEMIKSERIPICYLNKIFRQAQESPIILNAHKVREGKAPDLNPPEDPDTLSEFYFIQQADPNRVAATLVDLCLSHIPRHFHLDPLDDIQVLTPMHKGIVGTINLNQILQKALNQNPEAIESMGTRYKTGDKVMHLKNNYQKDVFNGDIGRIYAVDKKNSRIEVDYDGRNRRL